MRTLIDFTNSHAIYLSDKSNTLLRKLVPHASKGYIVYTCYYRYTVEPRLTVTSLVRSSHHYGHPSSVQKCIPPCKLAPCNTVASPLRSLLSSPMDYCDSTVPNFVLINKSTDSHDGCLIPARLQWCKRLHTQ